MHLRKSISPNQSLSDPAGQEKTGKGTGSSRRKALKQVLLAGAGVAIGGTAPLALADTPTPLPPPSDQPQIKAGPPPTPAAATPPTPGTNYLLFSGLDFKPLVSSTTYSHANFSGVYVVANAGFFVTTVSLPQKAKITQVEFYTLHNSSGTTSTFYFSLAIPASGVEGYYLTNNITTINSSIVTVPLSFGSSFFTVDNTSSKYLLYWSPGAIGSTEVLYGARIGYTGGLGRFGV